MFLTINSFTFIEAQVRSTDLITLYFSFMVILTLKICALQKSPCNLAKEIGPCRFKEPCKPTVLPWMWNASNVVVSWEGLFEGCHEDQIDRIYIGSFRHWYGSDKLLFAENKFSFSLLPTLCAKSLITIRLDFKDDHINKNPRQGKHLFTQGVNCSASLTRGKPFFLVILRTPFMYS